MVDTVRTLAALQTLLADNTGRQIDPQDLRDFLVSVYPQWEDYTPTFLPDGGGGSVGNGTLTGRFIRVGDPGLVIFNAIMTWGSTTANGSGGFRISLPATPVSLFAGSATLSDASVGGAHRSAGLLRSDGNVYIPHASGLTSGTSPWTWATGDRITITGMFEEA